MINIKHKLNFRSISIRFRVVIAIIVPLIIIMGAIYLYMYGNPFRCAFYYFTGLYCPGCGSGRAAYDLLHFRLLDAISHNVFFVIALPIVGYYGFKKYIEIVFSRDILPFFVISYKKSIFILLVIFIYTIVRNIPIAPFIYLAP